MGVSPGERQDARYVGASPGERLKCAESGCFPGRDDCARKMDIPRTKCIIVNVLLDDYCIRPALVPFAGGILHICKHSVYYWIIIEKDRH